MEGNFSQVYVHQTKELSSAMKSYDTVAVDRFRRMEEDYHNGRRGGGTPQSFWRGCGPNLKTLFQTKICDFHTLFQTWVKNWKPISDLYN